MILRRRQRQKLTWLLIALVNCLIILSFVPPDNLELAWIKKFAPGRRMTFSGTRRSTDGYRLANYVQEQCSNSGYNYNWDEVRLNSVYSTSSKNLHVCPIWKVGSTFIKRLFMIENLNKYRNYSSPYEIGFMEQYEGTKGAISNTDGAKRFMFVRNPYQRLLSVYVDKLLAPNPVYWKILGVPAIKVIRKNPSALSLLWGHDITFSEYIKYVIHAMEITWRGVNGKLSRKVGVKRDYHFELMTAMCRPCHVKYDFVGKMESFQEDSLELLLQMNLTKVAETLENNGVELAVEDAIKDTTYQPFNEEFKKQYLRTITVKDALERSWKKLQSRGLIGRQELDVTPEQAETLTSEQFLQKALKARRSSSSAERKAIKKEIFNEMYNTIDREDLEQIRKIYYDDFQLFDYESRPKELFGSWNFAL